MGFRPPRPLIVTLIFAGGIFLASKNMWSGSVFLPAREETGQVQYAPAMNFDKCGSAERINCVVDGDTFYLNGNSIRVADIDAPETYGARCSYEKNLGDRATRRFMQLLNEGAFVLVPLGNRDEDRYGRKLRTVQRSGVSLGSILVSEGLARVWEGRRRPWCG